MCFEKKKKMLIQLAKLVKFVKLSIRLFNLINLMFFNFNNILTLLLDNDNSDGKEEDKQSNKEYNMEIRRNILCLKFIISVGIIGWLNMNGEQVGCIIIANILSELIEALTYRDKNEKYEEKDEDEDEEN
jgi:hypothetical protein